VPLNKYIKISIAGQELDLGKVEDLSLAISYALQSRDNFQQKSSSTSYNVTVPATTGNDKIGNTYHNPSIEDLSAGQVFRSHRPAVIEANGQELLIGKAFLISARHTDKPTSYEYNFYGNNGDWIIDLKEKTLYDFLNDITFPFTKDVITQ
jgi:hypothetical protein